jgi:hypothetical protein
MWGKMDFNLVGITDNRELTKHYIDSLEGEIEGMTSADEFFEFFKKEVTESELNQWEAICIVIEDNTDGLDDGPPVIIHDMFCEYPSLGLQKNEFVDIVEKTIARMHKRKQNKHTQ